MLGNLQEVLSKCIFLTNGYLSVSVKIISLWFIEYGLNRCEISVTLQCVNQLNRYSNTLFVKVTNRC